MSPGPSWAASWRSSISGAVRRRYTVEYAWKVEVGRRDWPGSGVRGAPPAELGFVYAIAFDQGTPGFAIVTAEVEGADEIDRVIVLVLDENGVIVGEQHDIPLGEVATLVAPPGGSIEWPGLVGVEAKVLAAVNGVGPLRRGTSRTRSSIPTSAGCRRSCCRTG